MSKARLEAFGDGVLAALIFTLATSSGSFQTSGSRGLLKLRTMVLDYER